VSKIQFHSNNKQQKHDNIFETNRLEAVVLAAKGSSKRGSRVAVDDGLHRGVRSSGQEKQSDHAEDNVEKESEISPETACLPEVRAVCGLAHVEVCHAPEDEPEERVEQGAHQRQQIGEERNDFGDDECEDPEDGEDGCPCGPTNHGVVTHVACVVEEAEEDEACRYRGVENTKEDDGRNHEGKGNLLVHFVLDGTERWRRHVLSTGVGVDNTADAAEDDNLSNGDCPEGLGEVLGVLHLGNEARQGNLSDEGVADVHESAHASHKCGASHGHRQNLGLTELRVACRVISDSREDGGQDD